VLVAFGNLVEGRLQVPGGELEFQKGILSLRVSSQTLPCRPDPCQQVCAFRVGTG
jgi:hypothetical protein